MSCAHIAGKGSSLQLVQIKSVTKANSFRYAVECKSCGRMTDWFETSWKAKVEAYYECWMDER